MVRTSNSGKKSAICGKLGKRYLTLRRDTLQILRTHLVRSSNSGKKSAILRRYPKMWASWAKSLRAEVWGKNTWGNQPTRRVRPGSIMEFGEKNIEAQGRGQSNVLFSCGKKGTGANITKHRRTYVCGWFGSFNAHVEQEGSSSSSASTSRPKDQSKIFWWIWSINRTNEVSTCQASMWEADANRSWQASLEKENEMDEEYPTQGTRDLLAAFQQKIWRTWRRKCPHIPLIRGISDSEGDASSVETQKTEAQKTQFSWRPKLRHVLKNQNYEVPCRRPQWGNLFHEQRSLVTW